VLRFEHSKLNGLGLPSKPVGLSILFTIEPAISAVAVVSHNEVCQRVPARRTLSYCVLKDHAAGNNASSPYSPPKKIVVPLSTLPTQVNVTIVLTEHLSCEYHNRTAFHLVMHEEQKTM
jgi:hypothetical protein